MAQKKQGKRKVEQYEHKDKKRLNNPPAGLVTPETDPDVGQKKAYAYDPHLDPQLVWAGKAEHTSFEVPTVSLHVHERIDPSTIIQAVRKRNGDEYQPSLFESPGENPPIRQAVEFYKHAHGWSNRLIAGDSLLVMNSLLEKEGMAGKVQMIYIDPPYGITYKANFQPFVNKPNVKDGKDEDLTAEPEQIRAFRDTWELGIHSYLTYLRDRLLLARELLHESGSIFVQIDQTNVHYVQCLMDEVLGARNAVAIIPFRKKTMPLGTSLMEQMDDFILWYAKNKAHPTKYRELFLPQSVEGDWHYQWAELPDGHVIRLTQEQVHNHALVPDGARLFMMKSLEPSGPMAAGMFDYTFNGRRFTHPKNGFATTYDGMRRLEQAGRIGVDGNRLSYRLYAGDYPITVITAPWQDTIGPRDKVFAVQTSREVVQRCILMTTDPGDLVLDITCGSGTTAFVCEQWGRRWITCDTSRVAIAIAKQRLMTAVFDYYELAHPEEGVGSGFRYKTVPHVTLESIANNPEIDGIHARWQTKLEPVREQLNGLLRQSWEEWQVPREAGATWPEKAKALLKEWWQLRRRRQEEIDAAIARHAEQVTLYDQPFVDKKKVRVTGPFTVEAVPAPSVLSVEDLLAGAPPTADTSIARSGPTLRQAEWRDELLKTGIRGKGGQSIRFVRLEPLPGCRWLHADGETTGDGAARVVVSFGPDHAPLEQRQVASALEEAQTLVPRPKLVIFAAFQFDPEAAKDIEETKWPGVTLLKAQMNADLLTEDLKKKRASNESFWLIGQPDVQVEQIPEGEHKGKYRVAVQGFDYYNTVTGNIESGGADRIAMWLLDTNYDGRSLFPRQVFFPMAGEKEGWAKLARNLRADIDPGLIEAYRGTVSLPFEPGEHKRIGVKIVDDRGVESLKIVELD